MPLNVTVLPSLAKCVEGRAHDLICDHSHGMPGQTHIKGNLQTSRLIALFQGLLIQAAGLLQSSRSRPHGSGQVQGLGLLQLDALVLDESQDDRH